jgi:hypothetical protein
MAQRSAAAKARAENRNAANAKRPKTKSIREV